jgi:hypothetical protein
MARNLRLHIGSNNIPICAWSDLNIRVNNSVTNLGLEPGKFATAGHFTVAAECCQTDRLLSFQVLFSVDCLCPHQTWQYNVCNSECIH